MLTSTSKKLFNYKVQTRSVVYESGLKKRLEVTIPQLVEQQKLVKPLKDKIIHHVTVDQAYGGMRDIKCMIYETSLLDAQEGIRFRGLSIPECQERLPRTKGATEPTPEALFWLLMTGEVPTQEQQDGLTKEWNSRAGIPKHVEAIIDAFPDNMHPMSQLSAAILALQTESVFHKRYSEGMHKKDYWHAAYEDSMNIIANLPIVASRIYRNLYRKGQGHIAHDPKLDYSANFANMLGFGGNKTFDDLMRLYLVIHSDHEGGNVSAHTVRLVGSALSDPYLAFAAGMNGLAGPLHGLANQEVLKFLRGLQEELGNRDVTNQELADHCNAILKSGRVIPGYGHAVLRKTDPRYTVQREFAQKYIPNTGLVKLVGQLFEVAPPILQALGKVKNPWPNVDSHSGALLVHFNLTEENFYTVLFGVSRALGVLASLTLDRATGVPLERPKSLTTEWILQNQNSFE
jgi:citrate synthase